MHTTTTPATTRTTTSAGRRFIDPNDLICPECRDRALGVPPVYWQVSDGLPVAGFSHPDRTALCRTPAGQIAEPVEVTR
ncbi:MAG: hypothetical protein H0W01_08700 [Pseudonocardiales bacterium]|nr:hypothetical protein [Pseudonocardiales bacterium]